MRTWQIQEAKTHLSELVRATQRSGPQAITWHGQEVAVVLSRADYQRLSGAHQSVVEFIRQSPLFDSEDVDLTRGDDTTREVAV